MRFSVVLNHAMRTLDRHIARVESARERVRKLRDRAREREARRAYVEHARYHGGQCAVDQIEEFERDFQAREDVRW